MLTVIAHQAASGLGEPAAVALGVVSWVGAVTAYHRGWRLSDRPRRWRIGAFAAGAGAVVAMSMPSVEHLAADLVSAHMAQHVMMILLAGPAIAVSRPLDTLVRGLPREARKTVGRWRRRARLTPSTTGRIARPAVVWLAYGLSIWFWHGSGPYQLAARNTWAHLIEHSVFLGVAVAFWSMILVPGRVSVGFRILMTFTTAFHSVLLGALLTFSERVWYREYVEGTLAMGLDPLADQRLAGLLMWIPGGLVYTGAGLWLLAWWLRSQERADVALRQ